MSGPTELLVMRLGLIAVIFVFVAVVAVSLRGGLASGATASTPVRASRWRLVVVAPGETGLTPGTEFVLAGAMVLGRDGRAGIVLPDASVSTRHASLERTRDGWRLTDLGSTNGTFVEDRPVNSRGVRVRAGDRVTVGNVTLQLAEG